MPQTLFDKIWETHEVAHGLLDDGQMGTDDCMYLWALTLRLCLMRPRRQDQQSDEPIMPH